MGQGRSNPNIVLTQIILICSAMSISAAHAEYFGSPTGRTANFLAQPQLTLEATFSTGDFASVEYQQMGVRLNYQYTPKILVFGDIGKSELSFQNETSFGIGAYYAMEQSILGSDDSAVKVSLHQVNFAILPGSLTETQSISTSIECKPYKPATPGAVDWDLEWSLEPQECFTVVDTQTDSTRGPSRGGDIRNIAIELLISGALSDSVFGDSANWYANGGVQMLDGFRADDTVLSIGTGVVIPLSEAEVYAGFDYADETYVGIGYRYFVQ